MKTTLQYLIAVQDQIRTHRLENLLTSEGILYITILEPSLLPQIGDQIIENLWTQILLKNAKK